MINRYYHIAAAFVWAVLAALPYLFRNYDLAERFCNISDVHSDKALNYK